jgi:hypothetical protein
LGPEPDIDSNTETFALKLLHAKVLDLLSRGSRRVFSYLALS